MLWIASLWVALLRLHCSGLHLDRDCIAQNRITSNCMLRMHLFIAVALVCMAVAEWLQMLGKAIIAAAALAAHSVWGLALYVRGALPRYPAQ